MLKLVAPYKITRTDLPCDTILIKGRMLGLHAIGALVILPVAITYLLFLHPPYFLLYSGLCLVLLLIQPFVCRFKIEVAPSSVILCIKYLGFTKNYVHVPFQKVLIKENGFRDINEAFYEDYRKDEANYLALEFDNGWDGAVDYVSCYYGGKEFVFTAMEAKFEKELWGMLTTAIKETDELKMK